MPNPTPDAERCGTFTDTDGTVLELLAPLPPDAGVRQPWSLPDSDPPGDMRRAVEHAEAAAADRLRHLTGADPLGALVLPAEPRRGPQASPNTERHPPEGLRLGGHWACERPNPDKITSDTAFDFTCPDCRRVAEAVKRVLGADAGFVTRTRSGVEIPTQLGVHDLLDSTRRHNPEGKDHRR